MKIDDNLNLVLPVRSDDDMVEVYAYHAPISREVFEANYKPLAAVKAELASKGTHYQMLTGPSIASLSLKEEFEVIAESKGMVDDEGRPSDQGYRAFMAEITRLTTVLVATNNGWEKMPIDAAIRAGKIDEEEWREVESSIVFFTSHYWMTKKAQRKALATATASLLAGFVTSSPITELQNSLPKSTSKDDSANQVVSSVPV